MFTGWKETLIKDLEVKYDKVNINKCIEMIEANWSSDVEMCNH